MKNIDRIAMDVNIDSGEVVFIVADDTGNSRNIKTIEWFGSTEKWDRFIIKPITKEGDC